LSIWASKISGEAGKIDSHSSMRGTNAETPDPDLDQGM